MTIMLILRSMILILLSTIATEVFAGDDEALAELLSGTKTFAAGFEQISLTADGERAQTQSGFILTSRPNRFRWEVKQPVPQLVISDGEEVYVYDELLEQVTISPLEPAQIDTPALLLSGDTSAIDEKFEVRSLSYSDIREFILVPRRQDNVFEKLVLRFVDNDLSELEMSDSFGQKSIVIFHNSKINEQVPIGSFRFIIPENVDIFRHSNGLQQ